MSVRDRLTLIYTAIFAVAFVPILLMVYELPRVFLLPEIDADLETQAEEIVAEMRVYNQRDVLMVFLPPQDGNVFRRANTFVMVVNTDGRSLARSSNLEDFSGALDAEALQSAEEQVRSVHHSGQTLRVLSVPIRVESGEGGEIGGYLQVARTIDDYTVFTRLSGIAALFGLAAITGSAFLATLISPRLFRPLERIATLATQISRADDLSYRLPDTGRDDEIGKLTMALNQTLARLETLFRTQQRFLADVSHELRTPLTTIRGNMDLMRRMGGADPEALDDIQAELERMTRLVNDLLLLARADVGSLPIERKRVALDTVILDVYRQLSLLNPPVEVRLEEVDQVAVLGDADRLKQLILNLADNAIKYTPAGGRVCLRLFKSETEAHVEIADTGIGIPEEDLPYIFDRFYRVDKARTRAHGGSGLGLSIVKWIVDVHGGDIYATSEVGEGTTFHVTLPLLGEGEGDNAPWQRTAPPPLVQS